MHILGIHSALNQFNHDPGAALISDGELVAVCEEERLNRIKSSRGFFPSRSIEIVLKEAGITISDLDYVYTTGITAEGRLRPHIENFFRHYFGYCPHVTFVDHQDAHLASAFYCSGFDEAMCISYDGIGDGTSGKLAVGKGNKIEVKEALSISRSLGNFYSAATAYLGFRPVEDEYKVMGLASYGKNLMDFTGLLSITDDSYSFQEGYFRDLSSIISNDQPLFGPRLVDEFGPPRLPGEPIEERHIDIAYTIQNILERCIVILVNRLYKETGIRNLCIAGGVGLNCSANSVIRNLAIIDNLFIQPAASDRGLPLGAALLGQISKVGKCTIPDHLFLGPSYDKQQHLAALEMAGVEYEELKEPHVKAAHLIAKGKIIGWFQGRSEYGPRALGNRSILADPRSPTMKDLINNRVKFREEFRPFAPAVLEHDASRLFKIDSPSPYMTSTFVVRSEWRKKLPAVTHVDNTARVQTVAKNQNTHFYNLINEFKRITNVPVVLNTSFNARGEPIVETPENALATFYSVGLDALVLGDYLVTKKIEPKGVD